MDECMHGWMIDGSMDRSVRIRKKLAIIETIRANAAVVLGAQVA